MTAAARVRAITVQPPWSHAIVLGKDVENRKASPKWRGRFYVHAGKRWSARGEHDYRVHNLMPWLMALSGVTWEVEDFHPGHIVAVAELVDAHPDAGCCLPWGESSYEEHGGGLVTTVHHLVLAHVQPVPVPVPCRGALPLGWTVPADVVAAVEDQLP